MCGITGRFNFRTGAPVETDVVHAMSNLVAHRGPDGSGAYVNGPVGLGHRRLAVLDTSQAGRQPMRYGSLWITYNGEIYNFQTLRKELQQHSHRFVSGTDTEVILAAYREWGTDCLHRLRGMFAFAIWDADARELVMARDRIGKKPLYFRTDGDGLAFASEPKAFLAEPTFDVRANPEALSHYLSLQYVPAPLSAFEGVQRLEPGHLMVVRAGSQPRSERYWRLRYTPKRIIDERTALDELRAHLREAVRLRLISDVPLGAFLSGGIDSSIVVALMAEQASGRVKTFSIGFDEPRYDELPYARQVAERYGTDHREFVVTPDAVSLLPKLVWHYNEPYSDSSAVPTYYLAELTRREVTVALTGDAGDENFAGYDRYRANVLAGRLDAIPRSVRALVAAFASRLPVSARRPRAARAQRFLAALALSPHQRYASWVTQFDERGKRDLCTPEFLAAAEPADTERLIAEHYARSEADHIVDATLDVDMHTYLPDDLLVKIDIATMAHGLEARAPFLDHEVMEFASTLPVALKLRGGVQKYLLRRLAAVLLPASLVDRPKQGFGVPIDSWLRRDLRELVHDVLLSTSCRQRGYFRHAEVERLIREHTSGHRRWHSQLWSLLIFELWHQAYVDRRGVTAAPVTPRNG